MLRRTSACLLLAACAALAVACGGVDPPGTMARHPATPQTAPTGKVVPPRNPAAEKPVPFEVYSRKTRGDGKVLLELVVPAATSKEDAMRLGREVEQEYAGRYGTIEIFDSRDAARRRLDPKYPEDELYRHWLIEVSDLDGGKVNWVAHGRPGG